MDVQASQEIPQGLFRFRRLVAALPLTDPERFPDSFEHLLEFPMKRPGELWRWRWEVSTAPRWRAVPRRAEVPMAPEPGMGLQAAVDAAAAVTWVGHASFVLQLAGSTFLLDPVWSDRLGVVVKRNAPPGVPWGALPQVSAVLLTHNHYDHLDAPTIKRLPRDTPCLVPANEGPRFRRWGFTDVREFLWWDSTRVGGVDVTFVPAKHWSRRAFGDENRSLWGGWVLEGGGRRVYAMGDSGMSDVFEEIARRFPKPDLLLAAAGAYEPRWFMRDQHMTPEEAGALAERFDARAVAPFHWGTFFLGSEPLDEPPVRLARWWAERGLDEGRLWRLAVGETRPF